jgi:hypothetical protein
MLGAREHTSVSTILYRQIEHIFRLRRDWPVLAALQTIGACLPGPDRSSRCPIFRRKAQWSLPPSPRLRLKAISDFLKRSRGHLGLIPFPPDKERS